MSELGLEFDKLLLKHNMLKPVYKAGMKLAGNIVGRATKMDIPGYEYPKIPPEKYLGFHSNQYASEAVDMAIALAGGAQNLIIASDIDQTLSFLFDGFEDEALQRLLEAREKGAQVFLQTNRTWFPGTNRIVEHLKGLGFGESEIFKGMDQQIGLFRSRQNYARYVDRVEGIMRQNPQANLIQLYDVAVVAPVPTPQDLWGGQVLGLTRPLLKDLIERDSPIPGFGFIGINKFV
jgi:hypothetical protein